MLATLVLIAFAAIGASAHAGGPGAKQTASGKTPGGHHRAKHKPPTPQLALTTSLTSGPGVPIARPPVGLSIEYPLMASYLGTGPCPPPALACRAAAARLAAHRAGRAEPGLHDPRGARPARTGAELGSGDPVHAAQRILLAAPVPAEHEQGPAHGRAERAQRPARVGRSDGGGGPARGEQRAATSRSATSLTIYYLPNYLSLTKPQPGEEGKAVGALPAGSPASCARRSAPCL